MKRDLPPPNVKFFKKNFEKTLTTHPPAWIMSLNMHFFFDVTPYSIKQNLYFEMRLQISFWFGFSRWKCNECSFLKLLIQLNSFPPLFSVNENFNLITREKCTRYFCDLEKFCFVLDFFKIFFYSVDFHSNVSNCSLWLM